MAEPAVLPQPVEELSPAAELEEHVDESIVLKGGLQLIDEGVFQLIEDPLLEFYVVHLLQVDDVGLGYLFKGKDFPARWGHELDPAEGACSKGGDDLILVDGVGVAVGLKLRVLLVLLVLLVLVEGDVVGPLFAGSVLLQLVQLGEEQFKLLAVHIQ